MELEVSKNLFIDPKKPAVVLAPMEGVTDFIVRSFLTNFAPYSYSVTDFFRISQSVPKPGAFKHHMPEIKNRCLTPSGTSVQLQLLGGNAERMAASARNAVEAGVLGIDINFGCPAPTVNRNDGGATLLQYPHRITEIVKAVRSAVPAHIAVSAKLRLGWSSIQDIYRNAEAAAEGGASWLTIHARTKEQGYRPPVFWKPIGEIREKLGLPVIANGDIWTFEDFLRCYEETGCQHYMLGRSAFSNPTLVFKIQNYFKNPTQSLIENADTSSELWQNPQDWASLFKAFDDTMVSMDYTSTDCRLRRMKMWLGLVNYHRRMSWIQDLRRTTNLDQFFEQITKEHVAKADSTVEFTPSLM